MAKQKKSEPLNRWVALVLVLIAIFLGTLFISDFLKNKPITREEAIETIGEFKEFDGHQKMKGGFTEVSLFFTDAPRQYINSCCVSDELLESLKNTPVGTEFRILVNPNNDYVIEVVANNESLLDFDYSQKYLELDSVFGIYLGVFLYTSAIMFIVQAVRDFKKKFRRTKQTIIERRPFK